MTTTPPCHCNVSLLCSLTPPQAFRTLTADQTQLNNQFWIFKTFLYIRFPQKTPFFRYQCSLWPILFNIWKIQSWTKMLRKIHLLCFILEYFTPKTGAVKILPPPPKKTMLKGHRNISGPDVTTLIREGWREGPPRCYIHWGCPPCTTKCKILNTFCPRLYFQHLAR